MKNSLSPILLALQETFEAQPTAARQWADEVRIIEVTDSANGEQLWWVRYDADEPQLDDEQIEELRIADLVENDGVPMKKRFGRMSQFAIGVRVSQLKKSVRELEGQASKVQIMERKVKDLERQLKAARDTSAGDTAMAHLIESMRESYQLKPRSEPTLKFARNKAGKKQALAGVPTMMLSDWHWGECVDPAQIEYLNEFNLSIADDRATRVFNTALELLFHHQSGLSYDGFVLPLGGDMFSGNIHEELRITNDAPIHECLLSLAEKLAWGIMQVADNFECVYVPGVVGNHGRIDRKPTAKNATKDNYDWLLYNFVKMLVQGRMGDKCNVQFDISTGLDLNYRVYNTTYLLTHGDQIGGGSGVGGFWPSMMKTAHRKQQRSVKGGSGGFDYMVCGHFHKYGSVSNVIVNGSLKGYDEWVYKMNFDFERPIQALWITHPEHGIISHTPVYADDYTSDELRNAVPITPTDGLRRVR